MSEYEKHGQTHPLRTPRPAGTVSKFCSLSSARIAARGRKAPRRGGGFAASGPSAGCARMRVLAEPRRPYEGRRTAVKNNFHT